MFFWVPRVFFCDKKEKKRNPPLHSNLHYSTKIRRELEIRMCDNKWNRIRKGAFFSRTLWTVKFFFSSSAPAFPFLLFVKLWHEFELNLLSGFGRDFHCLERYQLETASLHLHFRFSFYLLPHYLRSWRLFTAIKFK